MAEGKKWADYPDPLTAWRGNRAIRSQPEFVDVEQFDHSKRSHFGPDKRVRKNYGLKNGRNKVEDGICPCKNECGHSFMWECEDADCRCCTAICN